MADEVLGLVRGGWGKSNPALLGCSFPHHILSEPWVLFLVVWRFEEGPIHVEEEGVLDNDGLPCACDVTVGSHRRPCAATARDVEDCCQYPESIL